MRRDLADQRDVFFFYLAVIYYANSTCKVKKGEDVGFLGFVAFLACSAGVFFERAICSRKRYVETSRIEDEMGRVKGSGEVAGREKSIFSSLPLPPFLLSPSHLP